MTEFTRKTIEIGARVRTVQVIENYPTIYLEVGAVGTLTSIDSEGAYWVTLDEVHPELAEWDNQVQIWDWSEQGDHLHPSAHLEVITTPISTDTLTALYAAYCEYHGLPAMSADELIVEPVAKDHYEWLRAFNILWEKTQDAEDQAARQNRADNIACMASEPDNGDRFY